MAYPSAVAITDAVTVRLSSRHFGPVSPRIGGPYLRAQSQCESERQDDSAKQNRKRYLDDLAANSQVFERHCGRQNHDHPLDSEAYKPRRLNFKIHGADQYAAGQETSGECSDSEDDDRSEDVRNVVEESHDEH